MRDAVADFLDDLAFARDDEDVRRRVGMLDTGRVTVRDVDRVRRRAVLLLGGLAAAMLLAGLLPWVTGGDTTIRLLALPLLLAGLMVAGAAMRVAVVRRPAPVTPVERGCAGCTCGAGSCAAGAGPAPGQPSADG